MVRRLVLVLALAGTATLPACKKQESTPTGGTAAPARAKVALAVLLDGQPVAAEVELGEAPRPLTELVPGAPALDAWIAIEIMEAAGPAQAVMRPAEYRPGKIPALTAGKAGVWFGWIKPGAAALEEAVAIKQVKVMTKAAPAGVAGGKDHGGGESHGGGGGQGDGERPTPTADLTIDIETPKGPSTFTGDKLVPLPTVTAPIGDTETPGWNFVDVMKAAGIGDAKTLVLTDSEGASLKLEAADLDPAKTFLYIKLNKSGVIRFRVFRKKGETWEVGGELRGITTVKVVS